MESTNPRRRGRPRSDTAGAQEAFDLIEQYRRQEKLSCNELAIRCGLTPSSVSRALADRRTARWTPTLKQIYSIAKNTAIETRISPVMRRLAAYEGPGEAAVKRLLDDVETLITTLSTSRR
jgi:transcriptional regulator with XRE-family HTH domain